MTSRDRVLQGLAGLTPDRVPVCFEFGPSADRLRAEREGLLDGLGVELDARGNVARDATFMTNVPGVFTCGDMGRGQSLIVWAIAEGRSCAAGVDRYLIGETQLAVPIAPVSRPIA